jgi:hypothetical protein
MPLDTASSSHSWSLLPDDRRRTAPSATVQTVRRIAAAPRKIRLKDLALGSNWKPASAGFSLHVEYNTNLSPQMNFFSVVAIFFRYNADHQMDMIGEPLD